MAHPLQDRDEVTLDQALSRIDNPQVIDVLNVARLFARYYDYPGTPEIKAKLDQCLAAWGMTREQLHDKCRSIWSSMTNAETLSMLSQSVDGIPASAMVGSGADVEESTPPA